MDPGMRRARTIGSLRRMIDQLELTVEANRKLGQHQQVAEGEAELGLLHAELAALEAAEG